MRMYRTVGYSPYIDSYEVLKRTKKHVWFRSEKGVVKDRRKGKRWRWHDSFFEARNYLLSKAFNESEKLEQDIKKKKNRLAFIKQTLPKIRANTGHVLKFVK